MLSSFCFTTLLTSPIQSNPLTATLPIPGPAKEFLSPLCWPLTPHPHTGRSGLLPGTREQRRIDLFFTFRPHSMTHGLEAQATCLNSLCRLAVLHPAENCSKSAPLRGPAFLMFLWACSGEGRGAARIASVTKIIQSQTGDNLVSSLPGCPECGLFCLVPFLVGEAFDGLTFWAQPRARLETQGPFLHG